MKTAVHLSSFPQLAVQYDLASLYGVSLDAFNDNNRWTSILNDIKSNINLDDESRKSARISKLNRMADWELSEIEYEEKNMQKIKKNDK